MIHNSGERTNDESGVRLDHADVERRASLASELKREFQAISELISVELVSEGFALMSASQRVFRCRCTHGCAMRVYVVHLCGGWR